MPLLCVLVIFGCTSIKSKAADAPGTLKTGLEFCLTLKRFANPNLNDRQYNFLDRSIKHIIFTNHQPSSTMPQKNIGTNVNAYYDASTGTIRIYCPTKIIFNRESYGMFYEMRNLESIDFNQTVIDTSNVTHMDTMFYMCQKLNSIDVSQFKTSNVISMYEMFGECAALKNLNLSTFDTSKVKSINNMFRYCTSLESLNVSSFNTSNVEDFSAAFIGCRLLKSLELSNFNTSKGEDMNYMFSRCNSLQNLSISNFDTSNVTHMKFMFHECSSLEMLDLSSFDLSSLANDKSSENFFSGCSNLKVIYSPKIIKRAFAYDFSSGTVNMTSQPVGKMALDDNNNGIPDNSTFYDKLPIASTSHKYLLVNKLENPAIVDTAVSEPEQEQKQKQGEEVVNSFGTITVTIDGITYTIDNDYNAIVLKIGNIKKASINKVTINSVTYPVVAIVDGACENNKTITTLSIGQNVKSIGKNAFKGCKKLKKITIKANKSLKVGKNAFKKIHKKAVIKVKGVKGNTKKKIVKAIKKQTKATVK